MQQKNFMRKVVLEGEDEDETDAPCEAADTAEGAGETAEEQEETAEKE